MFKSGCREYACPKARIIIFHMGCFTAHKNNGGSSLNSFAPLLFTCVIEFGNYTALVETLC